MQEQYGVFVGDDVAEVGGMCSRICMLGTVTLPATAIIAVVTQQLCTY